MIDNGLVQLLSFLDNGLHQSVINDNGLVQLLLFLVLAHCLVVVTEASEALALTPAVV